MNADGLLHHLHVELEAHRRDVAGLLLAEEVARPPDLEIVRGEPEATAQVVELLQHAESFLRLGGDQVLARDE